MKLLHEILDSAKRKEIDPCIYVHANGRIMISKSTIKRIAENNSIVIADKDGDIYARFDKNIGFRFSAKTRVFANRPLVEYLAKSYLSTKNQEVYYNENRIMRVFISEQKFKLEDGKEYYKLTKEPIK
jgi:hypothetical protein